MHESTSTMRAILQAANMRAVEPERSARAFLRLQDGCSHMQFRELLCSSCDWGYRKGKITNAKR